MIVRSIETSLEARRSFHAAMSTNLGLSHSERFEAYDCLYTDRALLYVNKVGSVLGGIGYKTAHLPNSSIQCIVERLLYSRPGVPGIVAARLIQALEKEGRKLGCATVLAGSSLHHNEATRRLYEHAGFKTNYSFRKDL